MPRNSEFAEHIRRVVRAIPPGTIKTYGEVAREAGYPGAARAVGTLMRHNHDPSVPCHRVVRSGGSVGEYNRGGETAKGELLEKEGIHILRIDGKKQKRIHYLRS